MAGFYIENFGCRATQADGAAIERDLMVRGLARASDPTHAEVAVLNSCTVTAAADADLRASIRRIHRANPACKIMVTGCYAQRAPEEIATLPGVTWVVGNSHKPQVAAIAASGVDDASGEDAPNSRPAADFIALGQLAAAAAIPAFSLVGDIFAHTELMAAPVFESNEPSVSGGKTRPNLKVQDGCDNRCSFCIIPFVRGRNRSLKLQAVLDEANALVAAGYREIVISGINLGRWGRDLEMPGRFEDLLKSLLEQTGIERLRISSVEPMDWSNELIELVAHSPRIAKHAHIPLQSGSDQILRRMRRKYRPWHYAGRIQRIHEAMPTAAIGADVMAGFPGETDALFEESLNFITALPFTYLHVFTFSARPGTPAAAMPNQVPAQVARERNRILRAMAAEKNLAFRRSLLGQEIEAITLHPHAGGTEALTSNFLKLRIAGGHAANCLVNARVDGLSEDGLTGTLASSTN